VALSLAPSGSMVPTRDARLAQDEGLVVQRPYASVSRQFVKDTGGSEQLMRQDSWLDWRQSGLVSRAGGREICAGRRSRTAVSTSSKRQVGTMGRQVGAMP
jgi:hypothetical protein